MAISIYRLGYKKLSQVIFEWQLADRTSLLALFIVLEIILHWLWFLFVWLYRESASDYVDMALSYPMWLAVSAAGLLFWWLIGHLANIKNDYQRLLRWQIVLVVVYTIYITSIIIVVGYSSLVTGVSIVGGAMLGMMLMRRRYVWRIFLLQILLILLAIISPYFGVDLPNLRQIPVIAPLVEIYNDLTYNEIMAIENAIAVSAFNKESLGWEQINELQRSSTFFWRATHVYFALPKAIFMVYAFRQLLVILDESRKEILQHAHQDELTTLDNRRYGLTQMQQTLAEAKEKQDYSVMLLDLDSFKQINDSYGHKAGDQVLREVAQILLEALSNTSAIISRYGGEEFLIVLPNSVHHETMSIAEQLRQKIAQHLIETEEGARFNVTTSFGVYTLTSDELRGIKHRYLSATAQNSKPSQQSARSVISTVPNQQLPHNICQYLINIADQALYKAKDGGRNKVVSANAILAAKKHKIADVESYDMT